MSGLEFNPPPPEKINAVTSSIMDAVKNIPNDKTMALIAVANEKSANAVFLVKTKNDWMIETWVGKSWHGSLEYGASVMKTW